MFETTLEIYEKKIKVTSVKSMLFDDFLYVMREYIMLINDVDMTIDIDCKSFFENPFFHENFLIFIGSAFKYKGKTILLLAKPYSGKTSVVCDFITRGAELISDDILLIEKKSLNVFPLKKPVCFREKMINFYNISEKKLEENGIQYRSFQDSVYGKRFLIHPFDIFNGKYVNEVQKIDTICFKRKNKEENYFRELCNMLRGNINTNISYICRLCNKCSILCFEDFGKVNTLF